jgi:hypothetical protein
MSLHTLVTIKMHCTLHNNVLDQHQLQLLLYCTHCDSVSTLIDVKKIILWCCILPTRTCKPRSLRCEEHSPLCITPKAKTLVIIMHVTSHTVHITVHVLHKFLEMGNCWFHCGWMENLKLYIFENRTHTHTHTHTHTTLHCIHYTLHFTVYFLKITTINANRTVIVMGCTT